MRPPPVRCRTQAGIYWIAASASRWTLPVRAMPACWRRTRRRLSGEGCPGSGPAWPGGARGSFLAGEGDAGGRPLASNHAKKDRRFGTGRERQEYERKCMAFPAACMHRRRIRSSWQGLGHAGMRSCGVGGAGLLSSPGAARSRLKAPPVALARKRAALPPVHSCAGEDAP